MKLPYRDQLIVEREKVTEYLLNAHHPSGGGKAVFFSSIGFDIQNWEIFADALRTLGSSGEVAKSVVLSMALNILQTVKLNLRQGNIPSCGPSGFLIAGRRSRVWQPLIHLMSEPIV